MNASVKFDDRALLSDLQAINKEAANLYLEYAVVKKRSAVSIRLVASGWLGTKLIVMARYIRINPYTTHCLRATYKNAKSFFQMMGYSIILLKYVSVQLSPISS